MKQLNLVLITILCLNLCTTQLHAQASCTGNARGISCYAMGPGQLASGAWEMNFPTGNLRYTISADCSSTGYWSEAIVWGAVYAYVRATPQNQSVYDQQTISGLDPNNSQWVDVLTQTSGSFSSSANAYLSIYTW